MFKRTTHWIVTPAWQGTPAAELFGSLENVFTLTGTQVARDGESLVLRMEVAGRTYYVKRYRRTKGIRSWLGFARIRLEVKNQLFFKQLGLPAAEVVAYGEERFFLRTFRGGLITLGIDNTDDLASTASNAPHLLADGHWVRQVSTQLAAATRTLHDVRFCHNDLKWRNVLVTQDHAAPQIYLIDCPVGQRWPAFLLKRRIIKDLACLDKVARHRLRRTQRLFFFKQYRQVQHLSAADKRMIYQVLAYFKGRD